MSGSEKAGQEYPASLSRRDVWHVMFEAPVPQLLESPAADAHHVPRFFQAYRDQDRDQGCDVLLPFCHVFPQCYFRTTFGLLSVRCFAPFFRLFFRRYLQFLEYTGIFTILTTMTIMAAFV